MKALKLILIVLVLTGCISSCIVHRGTNYGSRKFRRGHMPQAPPGYRGM